jgi:hypothetical protein
MRWNVDRFSLLHRMDDRPTLTPMMNCGKWLEMLTSPGRAAAIRRRGFTPVNRYRSAITRAKSKRTTVVRIAVQGTTNPSTRPIFLYSPSYRLSSDFVGNQVNFQPYTASERTRKVIWSPRSAYRGQRLQRSFQGIGASNQKGPCGSVPQENMTPEPREWPSIAR